MAATDSTVTATQAPTSIHISRLLIPITTPAAARSASSSTTSVHPSSESPALSGAFNSAISWRSIHSRRLGSGNFLWELAVVLRAPRHPTPPGQLMDHPSRTAVLLQDRQLEFRDNPVGGGKSFVTAISVLVAGPAHERFSLAIKQARAKPGQPSDAMRRAVPASASPYDPAR